MLMRTSPGAGFSGVEGAVRTENVRVPSGSGDMVSGGAVSLDGCGCGSWVGGTRGMNVLAGNEGERRRRYQPRLGR